VKNGGLIPVDKKKGDVLGVEKGVGMVQPFLFLGRQWGEKEFPMKTRNKVQQKRGEK